jgi:peptidoglycan/LPS O-acetylase OafA/YrhL
MYFLLPFLFFFLRKNFSVWPILALWVAAVAYSRANFPPDNPSFVVCIPYFLPGIMSYVLFSKLRPRLPVFLMPVLIALLLALFMIHPGFRLGWFLTLFLGLALPSFRQLRMKWLIRASHNLAKYSYGIYLIHPFSIALAVTAMRGYNPAIRLAVLVGSMLAIVIPAYHLIERPLIGLGARLAHRIRERQKNTVQLITERALAD